MKRKGLIVLMVLSVILMFSVKGLTANASELISKEVVAVPGDTSTELQNLLNYNKDGNYNLTIVIPAGEYILNKELHIFSNTTIKADDNAKLIKKHQRGAIIANDLSGDKGGYTTSKNITIWGGVWDSSPIAALPKGTESFRFIHATDVTIKNATVCNVPNGSHLITFAGVLNGVVEDCTLYGYGGSMLKEAIQIDIVHDNVVVPTMQEQSIVYDDLACDNILIKGCEIYDYARAIGSHTSVAGVFHKNITIENNKLHDLQDAAIKAYNYVNLKVSNNTIYNANMGVLVYTYISNEQNHYLEALPTTNKSPLPTNYNIMIDNNNIHDIKLSTNSSQNTWGDAIRTIGADNRPLSGVTIKNNTIYDIERYGVFLERTISSKITKNIVHNTTNSGIYLINGSHNAIIEANTLQKNGQLSLKAGGIGLNNSNNGSIIKNTISSSGKNGIFLYTNSNQAKISNNTITNPGESAIALYSKSNNAQVTSNTMKNYGVHGIYAYEVKSANIASNKIYGSKTKNSKDGIHITGDNAKTSSFKVKGNYIHISNRNAILIEMAPNCYISSNTIIKSVKTPIFLREDSAKSTLIGNKIS